MVDRPSQLVLTLPERLLQHSRPWRNLTLARAIMDVLTSMVKRVDVAVYEVLRDYSRGIFTSGVRQFGLAEGVVDIAYSGGFIDDIRPQIEDLRVQIIAGDVVVPSKPAKA